MTTSSGRSASRRTLRARVFPWALFGNFAGDMRVHRIAEDRKRELSAQVIPGNPFRLGRSGKMPSPEKDSVGDRMKTLRSIAVVLACTLGVSMAAAQGT